MISISRLTCRNNFRNSRVLIIGLGQLGLPIAKYVKEKGFDTYGYNIEQKAILSNSFVTLGLNFDGRSIDFCFEMNDWEV